MSSNRLIYDDCAYHNYIKRTTGPLLYRVYPEYAINCDRCLSVFGPRGQRGDSTIRGHDYRDIDVESMLYRLPIMAAKCDKGELVDYDMKTYNPVHEPMCIKYLDRDDTRLSHPVQHYRELYIDRFFDLPKDPQEPIFWDFAVNTRLQARDNFTPIYPTPIDVEQQLPHARILRNPCKGDFCLT
jgi:hypothetical protein